MKFIFLVIIIFYNFVYNTSNAQSDNIESIIPMMKEVEPYLTNLENDFYTISRVEIDLVHNSESAFIQLDLIGGRTYNILLIGENNKNMDIDLKIHRNLNNEKVLIKHENNDDNMLNISFQPVESSFYDIEVIAERMYMGSNAGRYALIVSF